MRRVPPLVYLVAVVAVVGALFLNAEGGRVRQPIAFNHKKHLAQGLTCEICHTAVAEGTRAGIPTVETCLTCHSDPQTKSAEEAKVRGYGDRKEAIPWKVVHRIPAHVYFSHRRHVALAKLDCAPCHGKVAARTKPFTRPAVNFSMDFCMRCHRKANANTDCLSCHL